MPNIETRLEGEDNVIVTLTGEPVFDESWHDLGNKCIEVINKYHPKNLKINIHSEYGGTPLVNNLVRIRKAAEEMNIKYSVGYKNNHVKDTLDTCGFGKVVELYKI